MLDFAPSPSSVSGSSASFGGEHLPVTYKDPATPPETILVRELEVDPGLFTFGSLVDSPAPLADFVCDRPAGWGKTLSRLSLVQVYDKALGLNFTVAQLYLQSRIKLLQEIRTNQPAAAPATPSPSLP